MTGLEAGVPYRCRVPAAQQTLKVLGKQGLCFCPCRCLHSSLLEQAGEMIWRAVPSAEVQEVPALEQVQRPQVLLKLTPCEVLCQKLVRC